MNSSLAANRIFNSPARAGRSSGVVVAVLGAVVGGPAGPQEAEAATNRPNILLIIADDFGVDSHPYYNDHPSASFAPTPNINRLYSNGVMFKNCYSYPTSSPTRSCLLTGRYGFRTGVGYALETTNDPALTPYELTLPELLLSAGAGYECAMFGKWHATLTDDGPNTVGGFPLFMGGIHGQAIPGYYDWWMVSNGYGRICTEYSTRFIAEESARWIESRPTDTNWFCWVAFHASHVPYHKPPDEMCPTYTHLPTSHLAIALNPRSYWEAITESLDWGVGHLLDAVDLTNTLVLFVGDNGTIGGLDLGEGTRRVIQEPYSTERGKATLYQGGVHVPMFAAGAGVSSPTRVCSNLVSVVDFFATILEVAGVDVAARYSPARPLDALSFGEALRDPGAPPHRTWVLTENFSSHTESNRAGRSILDDRHKYIAFESNSNAFFDLWSDPLELTNLYGQVLDPASSNSLAALQSQLNELQNNPCIMDVRGDLSEVSVAFINAVDFTLWSSFSMTTGGWQQVSGATVTTNEAEVRFEQLPEAGAPAVFYKASAPER